MVKLESGVRLGRYELIIELGRGGMASVWVAREFSRASNKQRLVALKVMLPKLAKDSTFRSMFLDEGGLVRSIEHENVVRVYEVAESQGLLYMAMEWVEGDSLRSVIKVAKQRRAIPPEMAVRIIADAAAGLHAAHELRGWDGELRGIVHCDVSPHNILIGPAGKAKLVDFGVAHAVSQSELDDDGDTIKGKFGYMSPEQALGRKFDRRSDLFSMGIVLFELTTGERLFRGRDPTHTLKLVTYGQIPQPSLLIPDYPPALESIVLRALERDVEKRFATAEELQHALERYLVSESVLVSQAGVGGLAKRVLNDRIQRRRSAIRATLRRLGQSSDATNLPESDVNASETPLSQPPPSQSLSPYGQDTTRPGAAVLPDDIELTPPPRRRRSSAGYIFAALLLVAVGGGSAYVIVAQATKEANNPTQAHTASVKQDEPAEPSTPATASAAASASANPEGDDTDSARLEDLPSYQTERLHWQTPLPPIPPTPTRENEPKGSQSRESPSSESQPDPDGDAAESSEKASDATEPTGASAPPDVPADSVLSQVDP